MAPMLLPATRSTCSPDSSSSRITPTWAKARAPPPASTSPSERPASRSPSARSAGLVAASARVSAQASVVATHSTRSGGGGAVPTSTRSGCRDGAVAGVQGRWSARATSTTASDWRRQKSCQCCSGLPLGAPPAATRTTRSPSCSARSNAAASTTPGTTTDRCSRIRVTSTSATDDASLPAWRPMTAITFGATGTRPAVLAPPAVRSRWATWVRTTPAAAGSVSSRVVNAARGTSTTCESRRARTAAERRSPVRSASSPSTSPGPSSRTSRPPTSTSSRPLRTRYADPAGSPSRISHSPACTGSSRVAASSRSRALSGRPPSSGRSASGSAAPRLPVSPARSGMCTTASPSSSGPSSDVVVVSRPSGRARTATARKAPIESSQPSRSTAGAVAVVGVPTIATRKAMPSTPPS